MQFSFRKPHFWHPQNFAKTLFWHNVTLFCFQKYSKNTIDMGKTVKKLGPIFNTRLGPILTLETPNLVVSGPYFRDLWVKKRSGNKRPVPSETTCFVVRNWGLQFADFTFFSAGWWNRVFCKKAILEDLLRIFFRGSFWASFFVCGVLAHGGEVEEVQRRETLQNKGFLSEFASLHVFDSSILQTFLQNNFCTSYKFVFRGSILWPNWVFRIKKTPGAAEPSSLSKCHFSHSSWASANLRTFGRAGVSRILGPNRGRCERWPLGCGAEAFRVFFGVLVSTPFSQIWSGPLEPPHFFLSCFSLLCAFSWDWGQIFVVFFFEKKHCFSLPRGIFAHFSVSPFLSPLLLSLPLFTLSLSLSLFVFSFLVLFYIFPSFFGCSFSPSSLLLFHEKNNINILHLKICFRQSLLFFWFPAWFCVSDPLYLS